MPPACWTCPESGCCSQWRSELPEIGQNTLLGQRVLPENPAAGGRVIERLCPQPLRKAAGPRAGQKVLVWYDPADPADVLVNGWDGRYSDRAFLAAGLLFIVFGMALAFGH